MRQGEVLYLLVDTHVVSLHCDCLIPNCACCLLNVAVHLPQPSSWLATMPCCCIRMGKFVCLASCACIPAFGATTSVCCHRHVFGCHREGFCADPTTKLKMQMYGLMNNNPWIEWRAHTHHIQCWCVYVCCSWDWGCLSRCRQPRPRFSRPLEDRR